MAIRRQAPMSPPAPFSRKCAAPAWIARTAVSMSPWPVCITTAAVGISARMRARTSMPSMPGILMSRTTRSTGSRSSSDSASGPDEASETLQPS